MSKRSKKRSDWGRYDQAILEAIRKIEYEHPFSPVTVRQIQKELKNNKNLKKKPARRSIYNHLYGTRQPRRPGLLDRELIVKVGRGLYSRKMAMISKKLAQEFLIREVYETVPRLEGEKFNEFLSRRFPVTNKLEREYRKKSKIPVVGLFYGRKLQHILATKRSIKPTILNWLRNDLDFIENTTEITVLSSKKLPLLNTYKIRETFADVLYNLLAHERELAEAKEEKFSLENFGLNIIVSFNPRKVGKPPRRPTMTELIAKKEKLLLPEDRQFLGLDEERLKRLKLLDKKRKEQLATRESEEYPN